MLHNAQTWMMAQWWLWPILALFAGILALAPLGHQVLQRKVVFIDLAVAQAAAAAVLAVLVWAEFNHIEPTAWATQLAATTGALLASACIAYWVHVWPRQREALIGLMYVLLACVAMLVASLSSHGKTWWLQVLAADVLWVGEPSAAWLALAACVVLWLQRIKALQQPWVFYIAFAVVCSIAVPALGLFVVFACLIAPALWLQKGASTTQAVLLAVAASGIGMLGSWVFDMPSGPMVTASMALYGLLGGVIKLGSNY